MFGYKTQSMMLMSIDARQNAKGQIVDVKLCGNGEGNMTFVSVLCTIQLFLYRWMGKWLHEIKTESHRKMHVDSWPESSS